MTTQITLPRDAEGREIPLDTRKVFDDEGNEWRVVRIEYNPRAHEWRFAVSKDGSSEFIYEGIRASRKASYARQLEKASE